MGVNPVYAECIERAALAVGGYRALSERLGVESSLLQRWARGQDPAPEQVFLKVVDLLMEQSQRAAPEA